MNYAVSNVKKMYRATYRFVEACFKEIPPSNAFLRATDIKQGEEHARKLWEDEMASVGLKRTTPYHFEIREVSEEEMLEYKAKMDNGTLTENRMVN